MAAICAGRLRRATRGRALRGPRPARARPPRSRRHRGAPARADSRRLSPPNSSISMPNLSRVGGVLHQRLPLRGRQLHENRRQQPLALQTSGRQPLHDLLEQHPLVRDVLIDDRHSFVVHRDDERVAELTERNHGTDVRARRSLVPGPASARVRSPGIGSVGPSGSTLPASHHRLPTDAPARTPGIVMASRLDEANAPARASAEAPARVPDPARPPGARRSTSWTSDCSRNRTSAFVGWTFTSTRSGGDPEEQVHLRASLLDGGDAVGLRMACAIVRSFTMRRLTKTFWAPRTGPWSAERGHVALDRQAASFLAHLHQVGTVAEELKEPLGQPGALADTRSSVRPPLVSVNPTSGIAERHLGDEPRHLGRFRGVGLQKLPARRQVVEEIRDLDRRAFRRADFAHRRDGAAIDPDLRPARGTARARAKHEMRDRRDARQRLTAEPQCADGAEIVRACAILLVACRSSASRASSGSIPSPSSSTRISFLPPSSTATAMRRAPASSAFSTSSLTTDAGRSTTSPAAI